jgi:hypothetical protein
MFLYLWADSIALPSDETKLIELAHSCNTLRNIRPCLSVRPSLTLWPHFRCRRRRIWIHSLWFAARISRCTFSFYCPSVAIYHAVLAVKASFTSERFVYR